MRYLNSQGILYAFLDRDSDRAVVMGWALKYFFILHEPNITFVVLVSLCLAREPAISSDHAGEIEIVAEVFISLKSRDKYDNRVLDYT